MSTAEYKNLNRATTTNQRHFDKLAVSPIYSHITATLQGLSTIRALNAQHSLELEFYDHEDYNTGAFHLKCTTNRAFAFWLDVVCFIFIILVTFSFVVFDEEDGNIPPQINAVIRVNGNIAMN